MDFQTLTRRQLQALCKKNKIPANLTNVAMADSLKALDIVEGIEDILMDQSEQSNIETPIAPRTGCRSSVRRMPNKEDSVSTKIMTRSQRGAKIIYGEDKLNASLDIPKTPAGQSFRRRASEIEKKEQLSQCEEKKGVPETPMATTAHRLTRATRSSVRLGMETLVSGNQKVETSTKKVYSTRRNTRLLEKKMMELNLIGDDEIEPAKIHVTSDSVVQLLDNEVTESQPIDEDVPSKVETVPSEGPKELEEVIQESKGDEDILSKIQNAEASSHTLAVQHEKTEEVEDDVQGVQETEEDAHVSETESYEVSDNSLNLEPNFEGLEEDIQEGKGDEDILSKTLESEASIQVTEVQLEEIKEVKETEGDAHVSEMDSYEVSDQTLNVDPNVEELKEDIQESKGDEDMASKTLNVQPGETEVVEDDHQKVEETEEVEDDVQDIEMTEDVEDDVQDIEMTEDVEDNVQEIEETEDDVQKVEKTEEAEEVEDDVQKVEETEEVEDDVQKVEETEEVKDGVKETEEVEDDVQKVKVTEVDEDDIQKVEETEEVKDDVKEIEVTEDDVQKIEDHVQGNRETEDDVQEIEETEEVEDGVQKVEANVQEIEETEEVEDDVQMIEDHVQENRETEETEDHVQEIEETEEIEDGVQKVEANVQEIEETEEVEDDVQKVEEIEEVEDDVQKVKGTEVVEDDVQQEIGETEEVEDDVQQEIEENIHATEMESYEVFDQVHQDGTKEVVEDLQESKEDLVSKIENWDVSSQNSNVQADGVQEVKDDVESHKPDEIQSDNITKELQENIDEDESKTNEGFHVSMAQLEDKFNKSLQLKDEIIEKGSDDLVTEESNGENLIDIGYSFSKNQIENSPSNPPPSLPSYLAAGLAASVITPFKKPAATSGLESFHILDVNEEEKNNENINGKKLELTTTDQELLVKKNEVVMTKDYSICSLRQLKKEVKQIAVVNMKEKKNAALEQVANVTRPALQVLSENQVVGAATEHEMMGN